MVSFSKVILLGDSEIKVNLEGVLTIPTLWLFWQFALNNLSLTADVEELKQGRLTDKVLVDLLSEFKLARVRKADPVKLFPLVMFYSVRDKKWAAIKTQNTADGWVKLQYQGQDVCWFDALAGYNHIIDDEGTYHIHSWYSEEEGPFNQEVMNAFGSKLPISLNLINPCEEYEKFCEA